MSLNGTVTVESFIVNSTSVNEYLLYIIGLDISTKIPHYNHNEGDQFIRLHDLSVAIHHGVYVSVQYTAAFECVNIAKCQHKSIRLPRIIIGCDRVD